jgi:preprotein translocase subunit SecG
MLQTVFTWIWLASGVLLVITVLLHSPKGDGMGGLASSGGSMFSSARSAEATLNRVTWTLLAVFLGLAIGLSAGWLKGF